MSTKSEDLGQGAADDLSALVDGELASSDAGRACTRWRTDPEARATWHAYQLIGDVLRSDDLASAPGHDRDFLATFRQRMAQEPVVLAPAPVAAPVAVHRPTTLRRSMRTSMAIAAGFVAVAGVLVVTQVPRSAESSAIASADLPAAVQEAGTTARPRVLAGAAIAVPVVAGADRRSTEGDATVVLDGQFIRDARLDEYLAAHKKFGGSSAPGGPSGFLRNATAGGR